MSIDNASADVMLASAGAISCSLFLCALALFAAARVPRLRALPLRLELYPLLALAAAALVSAVSTLLSAAAAPGAVAVAVLGALFHWLALCGVFSLACLFLQLHASLAAAAAVDAATADAAAAAAERTYGAGAVFLACTSVATAAFGVLPLSDDGASDLLSPFALWPSGVSELAPAYAGWRLALFSGPILLAGLLCVALASWSLRAAHAHWPEHAALHARIRTRAGRHLLALAVVYLPCIAEDAMLAAALTPPPWLTTLRCATLQLSGALFGAAYLAARWALVRGVLPAPLADAASKVAALAHALATALAALPGAAAAACCLDPNAARQRAADDAAASPYTQLSGGEPAAATRPAGGGRAARTRILFDDDDAFDAQQPLDVLVGGEGSAGLLGLPASATSGGLAAAVGSSAADGQPRARSPSPPPADRASLDDGASVHTATRSEAMRYSDDIARGAAEAIQVASSRPPGGAAALAALGLRRTPPVLRSASSQSLQQAAGALDAQEPRLRHPRGWGGGVAAAVAAPTSAPAAAQPLLAAAGGVAIDGAAPTGKATAAAPPSTLSSGALRPALAQQPAAAAAGSAAGRTRGYYVQPPTRPADAAAYSSDAARAAAAAAAAGGGADDSALQQQLNSRARRGAAPGGDAPPQTLQQLAAASRSRRSAPAPFVPQRDRPVHVYRIGGGASAGGASAVAAVPGLAAAQTTENYFP